MHRLAIGEHHDAQPATAGLLYSAPAANATISLFALVLRMGDYPSNPGFADASTIAAPSNHIEIFGSFHAPKITTLCCLSG